MERLQSGLVVDKFPFHFLDIIGQFVAENHVRLIHFLSELGKHIAPHHEQFVAYRLLYVFALTFKLLADESEDILVSLTLLVLLSRMNGTQGPAIALRGHDLAVTEGSHVLGPQRRVPSLEPHVDLCLQSCELVYQRLQLHVEYIVSSLHFSVLPVSFQMNVINLSVQVELPPFLLPAHFLHVPFYVGDLLTGFLPVAIVGLIELVELVDQKSNRAL